VIQLPLQGGDSFLQCAHLLRQFRAPRVLFATENPFCRKTFVDSSFLPLPLLLLKQTAVGEFSLTLNNYFLLSELDLKGLSLVLLVFENTFAVSNFGLPHREGSLPFAHAPVSVSISRICRVAMLILRWPSPLGVHYTSPSETAAGGHASVSVPVLNIQCVCLSVCLSLSDQAFTDTVASLQQ
jgi:hypothetical protein